MTLDNSDKIPAYERMHIWVLGQDVQNSPHLDNTQKDMIMRKLQEIVDTWTSQQEGKQQ